MFFMRTAIFDTHDFEQKVFAKENLSFGHELTFFPMGLRQETASLAAGFPCVCPFVNDDLSKATLEKLKAGGTVLIALRSAGFNHVDLNAAKDLGLSVVRVPEYSPFAVAEHAVAMLLTLNRKTHRAYNRVREGNFSLSGLVGFDLHGKTVGVIGTGKIGKVFATIMQGFGCRILLNDITEDKDLALKTGGKYTTLNDIFSTADIISLHLPLKKETHHLIDESAFDKMKKGVILINTGRGALIDTKALIKNLKNGRVGAAGLDVYEEESGVFFQDHSGQIMTDDVLARLMTFSNVLITGHQAFLTNEALENIAATTLENISAFQRGEALRNSVL